MNQSSFSPTIDEYLRKRLMPVEGAIRNWRASRCMATPFPRGRLAATSSSTSTFQQRYNIDGRIARALKLAKLYLDLCRLGTARNMVMMLLAGLADDTLRYSKRSPPTVPAGMELPYISMPPIAGSRLRPASGACEDIRRLWD